MNLYAHLYNIPTYLFLLHYLPASTRALLEAILRVDIGPIWDTDFSRDLFNLHNANGCSIVCTDRGISATDHK